MSSQFSDSLPAGEQLLEPELVQKIVDELKSQGTFDQFRKDCMAEVDTKPGYQNLRQRVCHSLNKFLDRQQWKPTQNKNQLRNQLRKHIEDSGIMENGVRRIVDQVVNPKILSVIEPEVEYVMYNILGVEKPSNSADMMNGNDEKASNVSSEDIEMRSVQGQSDDEEVKKKEGDSPSLSGNISPLTPEQGKKDSPELQGDISPLTPPGCPGSPHTPPLPPLPPPMYMPPPPQLADYKPPLPPATPSAGGSMSPVSDTELGDLSPPEDSSSPDSSSRHSPPPPPPPPTSNPPPLPPTDNISDVELPSSEEKSGAAASSSSELDIEDLEKAREAILAKMAQATVGDSDEGEIHTEDEGAKKGGPLELTSPIISDEDSGASKKSREDDHGAAKKKESRENKSSSDEDDQQQHPKDKVKDKGGNSSNSSNKGASSNRSNGHKKSSSNSSKKSSKDESNDHSDKSCSSASKHTEKKKQHRGEKSMKDLKKLEKIEKQVKQAISLKSDKFKDIDMFAPKAPKPKPPLHRPPSNPGYGSKSPSISSPVFGSKSPLAWGSKTPPVQGSPSSSSYFSSAKTTKSTTPSSHKSASSPKASGGNNNSSSSSSSHKKVAPETISKKESSPPKHPKELPSGHAKFTSTVMERTKTYPELPVSRSGMDKAKQHKDDFADSKRRLEEARARKIKEQENHQRKRRKSDKQKRRRGDSMDSSNDDLDLLSDSKKESRIRRSSSSSNSSFSRSRSNSVREEGDFHGFKSVDSMESKASVLKRAIREEEETLETVKDAENDTISIKGLSDPHGAALLLKKHYGGNPIVVHPPPLWLSNKLKEWSVPSEDLGLMSFRKPERKRSWKFISEHKFALKRRLMTPPAKHDDGGQLEAEMKALHSEQKPFAPFHGFESSDLIPPSLEPKSCFLQSDLWPLEMKRFFFNKEEEKANKVGCFSSDLVESLEEEEELLCLSTKHALNFIITPHFDETHLDAHDLPPSPVSLDSDDKGSSSPSSSKENVEEQTTRKRSKFSSNKSAIDKKSVIPRTRRNVKVLKKVTS